MGEELPVAGKVHTLFAISAAKTIAAGRHFDHPRRNEIGWIAEIDKQGKKQKLPGLTSLQVAWNQSFQVLKILSILVKAYKPSLRVPFTPRGSPKLETNGNLLWERKLDEAAGTSQVHDLVSTDQGELVTFASGTESFMVRFSADGQEIERRIISDEINSLFAAIAPSDSYVRTDGEYDEFDNYHSCWHPSVICPAALRVGQFDNNGNPIWYQKREDYWSGIRSAYGTDGTVRVLANCNSDGQTGMGTGLIGLAP